jgi:hypothetical protein
MFEDVTDPDRDSTFNRWIPPIDADEASRSIRLTCAVLSFFLVFHLWEWWQTIPRVLVGLEILTLAFLVLVGLTLSRVLAALLTLLAMLVAVGSALSPIASSPFADRRTLMFLAALPFACGAIVFVGCLAYHHFREVEGQRKLPETDGGTAPP